MSKINLIFLFFVSALLAGKYDSAVRAFENQPQYVTPIATLLGTIGSSSWNSSSSIPYKFSSTISLPLVVAIINDKDRSYSSTFVDSAVFDSNLPEDEKSSRAYKEFTAPTIFGREDAPTLYKSVLGVDGSIVDSIPVYYSDGIPDVAAFNWVPFPQFQGDFSFAHTAVSLRYIGRPNKSLGVHFWGAQIRYDFTHFMKKQPVNITLFSNSSFPILKWTPGEGIQGTIKMNEFSNFSGVTIGYRHKKLDLLSEIGWEYSKLKTSGTLYIESDDEYVTTNLKLRGRNRFRFSVVVSFNPGKSYRVSGVSSFGAEQVLSLTPVAFRFGAAQESVNNKGEKYEKVK